MCRRYITELNSLIISQLDRRTLDLVLNIFRRLKNVPSGMIEAIEASDKFVGMVGKKITAMMMDGALSVELSRAHYDLSMALKICLNAVEVEGSNYLNFTIDLTNMSVKQMKSNLIKLSTDFKWELELI